MARRRFNRNVEDAITQAAQRYGVSQDLLRGIARIESSGDPNRTSPGGGRYRGLFQLSQSEFERGGGRNNIFDPLENAMAGAATLRGHQQELERMLGRPPSDAEVYLVHNQGMGGFTEHMNNPDLPAWQNMANTREGRQRGEDWARRAVSLNIPPDARRHGPNLTSRQLMDGWISRVGREGLNVGTTPPLDDSTAMAGGNAGRFAEPRIQPPPSEDEALAFADRPDVTPTIDAAVAPEKIVRGVNDPIDTTMSNLFGVDMAQRGGVGSGNGMMGLGGVIPGADKLGAGLAAAGKALSSSQIRLPQFQSAEAQMTEIDRGAQQPVTIQARKPRKPPGTGRGGAA